MKKFIYLLLITMLVLVSCTSNDNDIIKTPSGMQELVIPDGFNFSSEQDVNLYIDIQNYNTDPVAGILFDIAYVNSENENMHIMQAITNEAGIIQRQLIVPSYVRKLFVSGLMSSQELDIINGEARFESGPRQGLRDDSSYEVPTATRSFSYLDSVTYNSQGDRKMIWLQ